MTEQPAVPGDIELVVWSGTGNSRYVADRIAGAARLRGASVRVVSEGDARGPEPSSAAMIGFLGPTHGFTAALALLRLAASHPDVRGKDAFVLVTRGGSFIGGRVLPGFEGTAAYLTAAILALRGARIRGAGAIDMPANWTVLIPAFEPAGSRAIVARGEAQTDAFADRILSGAPAFGGFLPLLFGLLILPVSLGYLLLGRLILAKLFFADERCTSCRICEARCPQSAVRLRGRGRRPYWTYRCHSCMRCMSQCPTEAIQAGQGWLLLYIWLMSLPVGALAATALGDLLGTPGWLPTPILQVLLGAVWILASVWVAYSVLWLGLLVPGVRVALSRATFTRAYRRYHGPEGE